jgi:hypothetical protein
VPCNGAGVNKATQDIITCQHISTMRVLRVATVKRFTMNILTFDWGTGLSVLLGHGLPVRWKDLEKYVT